MNLRIVTGGQDGADLAGWKAAKACGLTVCGMMPPYFTASSGRHPEYRGLYGAIDLDPDPYRNLLGEIDADGWKQAYRQRTILNVQMSHSVVWFGNPWSPGGRLTVKTAIDSNIDHYVVVNSAYNGGHGEPTLEDWIRSMMIGELEPTLMVAGNRESKNHGIEKWAFEYLIRTFKALMDDQP